MPQQLSKLISQPFWRNRKPQVRRGGWPRRCAIRFWPGASVSVPILFSTRPPFSASNARRALPAAAAIECIHCYSLVHDDLPSMDNDELRRGQPTVWKAYDEWTAILAGDALQALAFELISSPQCHEDPGVRTELVQSLAAASGAVGMVGGQVLDLEAGNLPTDAAPTIAGVTRLQSMKTGRLIRAACEMGAILGKAAPCRTCSAPHLRRASRNGIPNQRRPTRCRRHNHQCRQGNRKRRCGWQGDARRPARCPSGTGPSRPSNYGCRHSACCVRRKSRAPCRRRAADGPSRQLARGEIEGRSG